VSRKNNNRSNRSKTQEISFHCKILWFHMHEMLTMSATRECNVVKTQHLLVLSSSDVENGKNC
jgi:hypothetical protein